ncbi:hypothetical protein BGX38DRAFT_1176496 [Terfezia claveryi]|nr:hypothetical protein BGX38DRAFT_1176496 [Terfezia claveryi]
MGFADFRCVTDAINLLNRGQYLCTTLFIHAYIEARNLKNFGSVSPDQDSYRQPFPIHYRKLDKWYRYRPGSLVGTSLS